MNSKSNFFVEEIRELIEDVEYTRKAIQKRKGKFENFCEWLLRIHDKSGFSGSTTHNLITSLTNLKNDPKNQKIDLEDNKIVLKARDFISYAEEYFSNLSERDFFPRKWFLYFLDINPYNPPRIGRSYIETINDKQAKLITPESSNQEYIGHFNSIDTSLLSFEMISTNGLKQIHAKFFFNSASDKIALGTFSTFDKKIYYGSAILEQINGEKENTSPTYLSEINNYEEFNQLHSSIKEYLSLKNENYHRITGRAPKVYDKLTERLSNKYKNRKITEFDIENRFLEFEKPKIFISSPQTSIQNSEIDEQNSKKIAITHIIENVKNEFEKTHTIKYENTDITESHKKMNPFDCIEILEKTRYFILILTKTYKSSFSLLQLAWAVKSSKNILLIYEGDIISERIKSLKIINPNFISKRREAHQFTVNKISEDIINFIHTKKLEK
jgi:hypothetical protein